MTILYICKLYSAKGNGVITAINNEIKYLQNKCDVALYNLGVELEKSVIRTVYSKKEYKAIFALPSPFNKPDLVVFEEIYKFDYIGLYKYCMKEGIPYIIIPHGSLVKLEQKRKWLKKIVANKLFFNKYISNATAIQFLNVHERENSKFKYKRAIIIPNGLEMNLVENTEKKFKYLNFIFVGRYSIYTKGLDLLLESFLKIKEFCINNDVKLSLYGTDETGKEKEKLMGYVKKHDMQEYVFINGPVFGEKKRELIEKSYSFIQLSRHEAQPMGIIEALSFGVPCLVSFETSFGEYCNKNNCGIGVDLQIDTIVNAIISMVNNTERHKEYAVNAKKHSTKDFDIKNITKETIDIYMKIIKEEV